MIQITAAEARLLSVIQTDLPLVARPFGELGKGCGMTETEVIAALERFTEAGVVREISTLLDAKKIGFTSSLVAVSISTELERRAADRISAHPGVSHNYHRDHDFNIWFTIVARDETALASEVSRLLEPFPGARWEIMPALKTYKLRVNFRVGSAREEPENNGAGENTVQPAGGDKDFLPLSCEEQRLLSRLELPFPLTETPWKQVGMSVGMDESRVMEMTTHLKATRVIRRVAGVLRHRKIGYLANGMSCFDVADDRIDEAGIRAAAHPEVSHCYRRKTPPDWRYPLFAMIHAKTEKECVQMAKTISTEIGGSDHLVLFSTIEYKKERAKYFGGIR